ncbi:MAG: hypothetical protein IJN67_14070 [Oscillospiraceae bacterium]|nr:hypothetical protein [Oscillospiraceae bacterium]
MEQQKCLYILFSATPYRIGKCIRFITGEPYNHVSIATEEDLRECYGFARRFYETPFYGGFVTERPSRYIHNGCVSKIRLYRLPLTNAQWLKLDTLLQNMRSQPERYLYNHLSAMMAPMHLKVRVRDAFTCAEFVVSVLSRLGFDFDPTRFYTIGGIAKRLEDYHVYTGQFPTMGEKDHTFFQPHPLPHPVYTSAMSIFALLWRKTIA